MFKTKLSLSLAMAALTVGSVMLVVSCKKSNDTTTTSTTSTDNGYVNEHAVAEKSYDDAQSIADQANAVTSGSIGYKTTELTAGSCATVTRSVTGDTITIDFGTVDCLCLDGRTRRGKIIVTKTGAYAAMGSVKTITFSNYYQNDNQVTGTKTITNMGNNSSGQPYFNITVNGSVILASGAGTISTNWTRVRTWIAGSSTPTTWSDDVYSISGSGTLTRASGVIMNIDIPTATPLVVAYACRWIESGTITYTNTSTSAVTSIDFGSTSSCDNIATLTTRTGATYTISMP